MRGQNAGSLKGQKCGAGQRNSEHNEEIIFDESPKTGLSGVQRQQLLKWSTALKASAIAWWEKHTEQSEKISTSSQEQIKAAGEKTAAMQQQP